MADDKKIDYKAVTIQALTDGVTALTKLRDGLPSEGGTEPDVVKGARSGFGAAIGTLNDAIREAGV